MSLPKGFKRLEYIQSSGTQYVDTMFKPNQDTRVVCTFLTSTLNTSIFGSQEAWGSKSFSFGGNTATFGANTKDNLTLNDGIQHTVDFQNGSISVDNSVLLTWTGTFQMNYNMFMLANNEKNSTVYYSTAKLYSCQIYDNGTLVRDYIPCQNASGTVGLWDAVNGVFYGNAGTGVFTAGSVVPEIVDESEITELEYIQSSGTQYVNSNFYPTNKSRVVCDFQVMTASASGWRSIFGSRESTLSGCFALFVAGLDSGGSANLFYSNIGNTTHWFSSNLSVKERHKVDCNKNVISIDGESFSHTAVTFQSTKSIYLFANNEAGTSNMVCDERIYSCQIYDNGLLERDYIPAQLSNGEIGLYDRVFHAFYRNAGTGAFIPGNPIGTADITPTMTSNTTPEGYTASQSSAHGGLNAWYAFDGVDSTENNPSPVWHSNAGMPQWVMLQFPEAVKVTFFSIKNRGDVDSTYKQYGPKAFELQGSHDGADFVPLGAYTSDGALGATGLYRVQNPGRYQYYRVYVTEAGYVYNNQQYAVIDQIRFYEPLVLTPEAPANFRVESKTDTLVTLSWDAVSDAVGYRLYRQGQLLADTEETSVAVTVEPFAGAVFTLTAYNENGDGTGAELTYFNAPDDPILFLVTDRTAQDVALGNTKGTYNASDLNRVGYAVAYLADKLASCGVKTTVHPKTDWLTTDIPSEQVLVTYLQNVRTLRTALTLVASVPEVPQDMQFFTHTEANSIEVLLVMLDTHITKMLSNVDTSWAVGSTYTGLYAKEAYR